MNVLNKTYAVITLTTTQHIDLTNNGYVADTENKVFLFSCNMDGSLNGNFAYPWSDGFIEAAQAARDKQAEVIAVVEPDGDLVKCTVEEDLSFYFYPDKPSPNYLYRVEQLPDLGDDDITF